MSEDRFDDYIKKELRDLEQDYDPTSWDRLLNRMDANSSDTEEVFDQEVAETFERHRETPKEHHWLLMKEKLELGQARYEKVVAAKFFEFLVMLLLILTFDKYRSLTFPDEKITPQYAATLLKLNGQPETIQASVASDIDIERLFAQQTVNDGFQPLTLPRKRTPEIIAPLSTRPGSYVISTEKKVSNNTLSIGVHPFSTDRLKTLPLLPIELFLTKIELPVIAPVEVYAFEKRYKNIDGWSIGIPVSVDVNFVNTDFNFNVLRSQVRNGLSGTSIGVIAAYQRKGLELETGMEYSVKKFAPGLIRNYSESTSTANTLFEDILELVTFRQIQVPLLLKAYVTPLEKLSLYGTVGIAANMLLESDYRLERHTVAANLRPSSLVDQKVLDLGEAPPGLFQGGTIGDNLYITTIMGLGIQQTFSNGMSWYIQPQYQHSLTTDINEVASEVNSLSIELGIKYKL